jgi:hypothetical protein
MNKFARLDLGFKALLGRKTTVTAETSVQLSQLDWDNHTIGTEDAKWWTEAVAVATSGDVCACGQTMETGAAVCSTCLEESTLVTPSVCKGCGKVDNKVVSDFCRDCEVNGTEWEARGGNLGINDDCDEDEDQYQLLECPCGDEGCRHCNPL